VANIQHAKDLVRAQPRGIQLEITQKVADKLAADQQAQAAAQIEATAAQIIVETPGMTIQDGDQLVAWQEDRERNAQS
jgi:hypothetical protein